MLYPVAIEKGSEHSAFGVVVPDVPGCFSAGDTFEEALINAKEALELHLQGLAEMEELPPLASSIDHHFASPEFNGWVWALVDIDIEPYMGKASKINVTLPNLLTKKLTIWCNQILCIKAVRIFYRLLRLMSLNGACRGLRSTGFNLPDLFGSR